jgi:tetratricopeptide (TPR) repeat protein
MKVQLAIVLLCSLFCSLNSQAQNFPSDSHLPRAQSLEMEALNSHPVAFSGKVSVEGGSENMKDTAVVLDCGFGERARTNVDPKGHFMLMLDDGNSSGVVGGRAAAELTGCRLRAEAPGYQSSMIELQAHGGGIVEVGTIVISPAGPSTSSAFTVSAASLAAPDRARKNFEKGQDQAKKGRWAAACDSFRKAIQMYPRYAIAWLELGRAQLHQNNLNDAQEAFVSATTQDSKLLPAYIELAHVEAAQQQWNALARTTANIVELAPESSAAFWFLDSVANYNLNNLPRAESSAARGLRLDRAHRVPQLEYLYGLILGTNKSYDLAAQHIKTYLTLSPHAEDLRDAQHQLAEFERLASAQTEQAAR